MNVQDYMKLPYTVMIQPIEDESGKYFYARIAELDGCQSTGDTFDEAYQNLHEAMEGYIAAKLDNGFSVSKPMTADDYSGRFVVRLPKSLHRALTMEAAREGVSLNQYALYKLSK